MGKQAISFTSWGANRSSWPAVREQLFKN